MFDGCLRFYLTTSGLSFLCFRVTYVLYLNISFEKMERPYCERRSIAVLYAAASAPRHKNVFHIGDFLLIVQLNLRGHKPEVR